MSAERSFRDPERAFDEAIQLGLFKREEAPKFMYMWTEEDGRGHVFKHVETRRYVGTWP